MSTMPTLLPVCREGVAGTGSQGSQYARRRWSGNLLAPAIKKTQANVPRATVTTNGCSIIRNAIMSTIQSK